MAFSLTPKLTISLLLLLLSMFAFSAEAASSGRQKSTTSISGFFPNKTIEIFAIFNGINVTALPDPNSAAKAVYRSARVRLRTGPNVFFVIGEYSNLTDDSGYRYSGSFTLLGQWNQSRRVSRLMLASGIGDFYNATGSAYLQRFSSSFWRVTVQIRSGLTN